MVELVELVCSVVVFFGVFVGNVGLADFVLDWFLCG